MSAHDADAFVVIDQNNIVVASQGTAARFLREIGWRGIALPWWKPLRERLAQEGAS